MRLSTRQKNSSFSGISLKNFNSKFPAYVDNSKKSMEGKFPIIMSSINLTLHGASLENFLEFQ